MLDTVISQKDYTYNEIVNLLFELKDKYGFIELFSIGKSVLGRDIYAAKIGVAERQVLYSGAIHGSEWLTATTLMLFLEQYAAALSNDSNYSLSSARNALFGKSIVVVPISNPDGYEIARGGAATAGNMAESVRQIAGNTDLKYWNANVRGVDLNHNFDAGFEQMKQIEQADGITGPSPRRYGGEKPESEPESFALAEYCRNNYVAELLSIHSQGEEIYWQFGDNTPEKSYRLAQLFSTASGYAVAQPAPGASYAGFKDWFIQEFGRPGFTLEIGRGINPLDPSLLYGIYQNLEELFLLSVALA